MVPRFERESIVFRQLFSKTQNIIRSGAAITTWPLIPPCIVLEHVVQLNVHLLVGQYSESGIIYIKPQSSEAFGVLPRQHVVLMLLSSQRLTHAQSLQDALAKRPSRGKGSRARSSAVCGGRRRYASARLC